MPEEFPCREHGEAIAVLKVEFDSIKSDTEKILKKLGENGLVEIVHDHTEWIKKQEKKRDKWDKIRNAVLGGILLWLFVGDSGLAAKLIEHLFK